MSVCEVNPISAPLRILRSQWFLDPWTCGSYSYTATGCSGQDIDNLAEPLPSRGGQSQVHIPTCSAVYECSTGTVYTHMNSNTHMLKKENVHKPL